MKDEFALIDSVIDAAKLGGVLRIVPDSSYFEDKAAGVIFDTLVELDAKGVPLTAELVTGKLDMTDSLIRDAWMESVAATGFHPADHATFYAAAVAEAHGRRESRQAVTRLSKKSEADGVTREDLAEVEEALKAFRPMESTTHTAIEATSRMIEQVEKQYLARQNGDTLSGISYGIGTLDTLTGGLQDGQLVILGARPSVGKTSLGLSIINSAVVNSGARCLFVSLEMTEIQIAMRLVSIKSGVSYTDIAGGDLTQGNQGKIARATEAVSNSGVIIETKPGLTMPALSAQVLDMVGEGLDLVVIDYLGLLRHPKFSSGDSNYKEVSEISKGLKELALSANVPVVALAQLNRGSAKSERQPKMSDLRDSGSIEQDADIVALLHREDDVKAEYANNNFEPARLIIDKNRNGPTGRLKLTFNKPTMELSEWTRGADEWPADF